MTRNKHGALLRGLLWCTPCATAMNHTYTQKGDRRYWYYVYGHAQKNGWDSCATKSIPAGEIETFVVDRIRGIGTDQTLLAEVLKKTRADLQHRVDETELTAAMETFVLVWETPSPREQAVLGSLLAHYGRRSMTSSVLLGDHQIIC